MPLAFEGNGDDRAALIAALERLAGGELDDAPETVVGATRIRRRTADWRRVRQRRGGGPDGPEAGGAPAGGKRRRGLRRMRHGGLAADAPFARAGR